MLTTCYPGYPRWLPAVADDGSTNGGRGPPRKWQDQSGQDRYTTEVALSRFRGELTMLDGRSEAAPMAGGEDMGAPAAQKNGTGVANLDDEIPF